MDTDAEVTDRSLLLVEDNLMMAETVAGALRRRGYFVELCPTVAEARARLASSAPRHAVVDLRLPDGSGLSLVPALRRARAEMSIVVLTGFANIPTAIEAIKLGANNYLCKPVDVDTIDAALQCRSLFGDAEHPEAPARVPDIESEHIHRVLADCSSNISATARALGMHRRTLQRKLSRAGEPG